LSMTASPKATATRARKRSNTRSCRLREKSTPEADPALSRSSSARLNAAGVS
jgi:hypothetical protein